MKEKVINKVREFNRFYLPRFDLLGNSYLGSEYSATEARILFEVFTNDGCTASSIVKTLNIDKSYLSRIIRGYENKGYLYRTASEKDTRAYDLHLTEKGKERTQDFIEKSNDQIGEKVKALTESECERLISALNTVVDILKE